MKKILLVRGNPRKNGFTQRMLDFFIDGIQGQAEVTDIDLTSENIHPCRGCFNCWTATPGKCVQKDGMTKLLELFLDTDILVIASPLYAFSVSSYCKMFLERTLPLLAPGVVQNENGTERNYLRYPDRGPKKLAGLIVGGLKSTAHATGVCNSIKSFADGFGIEYLGTLVRTESYILQFAHTKPKTLKNIETAFYQAGFSIASDGTLSTELIEKAALQLAPDLDHFQRYSNIYWNYASEVCARGGDLDEARVLTNRDARLLMYEMARSIDPVVTRGIKASFQFEFGDIQKTFTILVDKTKSTLVEDAVEKPDIIIRCDGSLWVKVILREIDPIKPLTSGEIKLIGDKSLFRKLHLYFPPPKT